MKPSHRPHACVSLEATKLAAEVLEFERQWPTTDADASTVIESKQWRRWVRLAKAIRRGVRP